MSQSKVAIIVGSLRKDSLNLKLAKAVAKLGENKFTPEFLRIDDLPLFSQDLEKDFPAPATRLKNGITAADGILVVTPEYNRSMPGPLKNAIDWASRPYGANAFAKKPLALLGTSQGGIATACAQQALKPVFNYLDVVLMGQPEMYVQFKEGMIDDSGAVTNDKTKEFLESFAGKFADWITKHKA